MLLVRTDRLNLIPVTPENAVTLWRIMQSAHLREFQDVPRFTKEEFERRVASRPTKLESRAVGRFEWLIEIAESKRAIGWVSLRIGDHARGTAEMGYSLLLEHRGAGYAAEAVRAIVTTAFERSDLRKIEACCVPENTASRHVLQRAGFRELKVQRHGAVVSGTAVDIVIYELHRDPAAPGRRPPRARRGYGASLNTTVMPASPKGK